MRRLAWLPRGLVEKYSFYDGLRTAQGELIEHEFGEAWPRCPTHGSHPLKPLPDGWHCPAGDGRWDFGTLADVPVASEPHCEDGVVRWWLDDLGWGVVADHDGDVFVLYAMVEGEGYRSLTEGERVEYAVSGDRQGRFRQGRRVRRSDSGD